MNRRLTGGVLALSGAVVSALLSLPATAAVAETTTPSGPVSSSRHALDPLPGRPLRRSVPGRQALRSLRASSTSGLAEAARRNRMSQTQLTELLSQDTTTWMHPSGQVYYVDKPLDEQSGSPQSAQVAAFSGDPLALSSRPGASRIIYLDFDGADVTDTFWNRSEDNPDGLPNGHYAGYSLDDDPAFDDQESAIIAETWRRVAELYAPFDVNVTTVAPATDAGYSRDSDSDTEYGAHVVFTNDPAVPDTLCGGTCAGISYLDVYGRPGYGDAVIAWAFTQEIGTDPDYLAHVAAHEVGHQLSLHHDGSSTDAYYWGHGDWSPVMGGAAGRPLVQFSDGDYLDANNTEDDFALMAQTNLPLLPDSVGDDLGHARDLGTQSGYQSSGLISSRADVDVFRIDHSCTTPITASVTGTGTGSPLDLQLELLNGKGSVLASDNPPSSSLNGVMEGMDATVTTGELTAGSYYLRVDGVGRGTSADGYSDYGSVGNYLLTASGCAGVARAVPPGTPTGVAFRTGAGTGSIDWAPPQDPGTSAITGYRVDFEGASTTLGPDARSMPVTGLRGATSYTAEVTALSDSGSSDPVPASATTTTWAPTSGPGITRVVSSTGAATLSWAPPSNPGAADLAGWQWQLSSADRGLEFAGQTLFGTRALSTTLRSSATYTFTVAPVFGTAPGIGTAVPASQSFRWVRPVTRPSAPRIGKAASGARHGRVTARARWAAPTTNGGAAVTAYRIRAARLDSKNRVVRHYWSTWRPASSRSYSMRLRKGRYRFQVVAKNRVGNSRLSRYSNIVTAR